MRASAGILLYQTLNDQLSVLLVHPGGPFWAKRDWGAWSIPKGEFEAQEGAADAAKREFMEETGSPVTSPLLDLGCVRQASGKIVVAFAARGAFDVSTLKSNLFEMEWPPRSGRRTSFPEVDRAEWFDISQARLRIIPAQTAFIDRLAAALS